MLGATNLIKLGPAMSHVKDIIRAPACRAVCSSPARTKSSASAATKSTSSMKAQVASPSAKGAIAVEPVRGALKPPKEPVDDKCGPLEDDDESDMVQMVDPKTGEWGGPTKGGKMAEPTRFGDWERKGRCSDFS